MAHIFNQAFEQKLIYVYRINDEAHEGILKIGEASCSAGMAYFAFKPNCKELNAAAKEGRTSLNAGEIYHCITYIMQLIKGIFYVL